MINNQEKRRFVMIGILIGLVLVGVLGYSIKKYMLADQGGQSQEEIIREIDELVNDSHMLGTLRLIKEGKTVYEKSYGESDHTKKIPNRLNTLYPIASLQKAMTAVMIAQLIREGKIEYTTTIDYFYPEVPHTEEITIRDLLDFTSGYFMPEVPADKVLTTEKEQLENVIKTSQYLGKGVSRYSNGSYSFLAGIISLLDKQTYQKSLQKRILDPLGMTNTYFWDDLPQESQIPQEYLYLNGQDYQVDNNVYSEELISTLLGAGNLYATAADLGKFETLMAKELLNADEYLALFGRDSSDNILQMGNISSDGQFGGYSSYIYSNRKAGTSLVFLVNQTSLTFNSRTIEKLYHQLLRLN